MSYFIKNENNEFILDEDGNKIQYYVEKGPGKIDYGINHAIELNHSITKAQLDKAITDLKQQITFSYKIRLKIVKTDNHCIMYIHNMCEKYLISIIKIYQMKKKKLMKAKICINVGVLKIISTLPKNAPINQYWIIFISSYWYNSRWNYS